MTNRGSKALTQDIPGDSSIFLENLQDSKRFLEIPHEQSWKKVGT